MAGTRPRVGTLKDDIILFYWNAEISESKIRSAFRSKRDWVVSSHLGTAAWYSTVLSNLSRTYHMPEKATTALLRAAITHGLRRDAFDRLKNVLNSTAEQLSQVVGIPARTVARRSVFKPDESERILRVASTFQRSIEVLGSLEKARHWFSSPKRAIGGKTPFEFCDTELGAREVTNLLGRIEHGVFS